MLDRPERAVLDTHAALILQEHHAVPLSEAPLAARDGQGDFIG